MTIEEQIKRYIEDDDIGNNIYNVDETDKYVLDIAKEYLKEDHGYFEIVLDFSDYDRMKKMIDSVPDRITKNFVARQYMLYKIMREANLQSIYYSKLEDVEEKLFSGNFDELLDVEMPLYFIDIEDDIKKLGQETKNKIARIHLFLDNVSDEHLQISINDLFALRSQVAVIAYTTKPLLTHVKSDNMVIEEIHDYRTHELGIKEKSLGGII